VLQTTARARAPDATQHPTKGQHGCDPTLVRCVRTCEERGDEEIRMAMPRRRGRPAALNAQSFSWRGLFC